MHIVRVVLNVTHLLAVATIQLRRHMVPFFSTVPLSYLVSSRRRPESCVSPNVRFIFPKQTLRTYPLLYVCYALLNYCMLVLQLVLRARPSPPQVLRYCIYSTQWIGTGNTALLGLLSLPLSHMLCLAISNCSEEHVTLCAH